MPASSSAPGRDIGSQEKSNFDTSKQAAEKKRPQKHQGDALAPTQAIKLGTKRDIETAWTREADNLDGIGENDSIGG